jgi:monoamine oxidase
VAYDVVIVGAGAAGLAAAAAIARYGRSALVLEARDRIGGRCWSLDVPGMPVPVELGAEFIHGRPPATFSLLERTGVAAIDRVGSWWHVERGRLRRTGDVIGELRSALRRRRLPRKGVSFETYLNGELRRVSARARAFALRRVEGYDAADPARVSARSIVEEWFGEDDAGAASHFRPLGGYARPLEALARTLEGTGVVLRLGAAAAEIHWRPGQVEINGREDGRSFQVRARRAIVTLPLGVLQLPPRAQGAVVFAPALAQKERALRGLAPSPVMKVVMRFASAFWDELDDGRYADAAFLRSLDAPFPSVWTALPVRTPLLVAWAGGPRAERLSNIAPREVMDRAIHSVESIFGKRANVARRLEAAWFHDWQQDPFARGAYSYVTVGGEGARKELSEPLQDTLFFAGEATDFSGEHGTVAGALASGTRAARQVLAGMKHET